MTAKSLPDTVLLISDLHLSPARPDLSRAFRGFVESRAAGATSLYILGDLFDAWIGDDDDTPLYANLATALKRLAASGTSVYLMHGNRDFLLGKRYAAACGATLIHEPYVLEQDGKRFVLMHGDALCTRDVDYLAFRSMVRAPQWQNEFLAKPLAERRAFAEKARAQSRSMSSNKPEDIMDVTPSEVERVLTEYQVPTLIHGHTHRPAVHSLTGTRTRIVLGDWDKLGWLVRIAGGEAKLERFELTA